MEFELDIERLPSGKFATYDRVMSCAVLAYNILRWMGLEGLSGRQVTIRHESKRRRLKTVIQELMYVAARVVEGGRWIALKFSRHCPAFPSFEAVYAVQERYAHSPACRGYDGVGASAFAPIRRTSSASHRARASRFSLS